MNTKTRFFRRQLLLAVAALLVAGVLPANAARFSKHPTYRTAVFQTASTAKIAVGTNHSATLLDVKVGDQISIAYDQENGALVAHHISDGVPPKPRTISTSPLPVAHAAHTAHHSTVAPVYFRVRGVVQSVDAQSGTVTLTYKARA